ncbi:hypothetical protein [Dyadobacter sp. CY323]|uniref:hypothetical protein n=1 Tax=Dyadobacter sp. CY323 TaxID=2907302 RepID=UPI001F439D97|nr:hypothetical protein [Dyadobacter sp. CY323]MCE6988248.1 hypothetical protein [Dyadobacter sp. CY323]
MESLFPCVSLIFGMIAFLTVFTFFHAAGHPRGFAIIAGIWILVQSAVSSTGFYTDTGPVVPRMLFMVVPPVVLIAWLFLARPGKVLLDQMDMHLLTVIHVVRAPFEVILYWLYISKVVPQEMTFGGGNPDILSGLTAPAIYYWGLLKGKVRWQLLVLWNLVSLGLLLNVILRSILSAPLFFQTIGFEQPNVAVLHFPFVFWPGAVAPIIVCSHLIVIRNLVKAHWYELKSEPAVWRVFQQFVVKLIHQP